MIGESVLIATLVSLEATEAGDILPDGLQRRKEKKSYAII